MGQANQFRMLAGYNAWANKQVLDACQKLPKAAYFQPRKAFFGSIHGTLNHMLLVEKLTINHVLIFDQRRSGQLDDRGEKISALDQILHDNLPDLIEDQTAEDQLVIEIMESYDDATLDTVFTWTGLSGARRELYMPVAFENFFLHQTHHRGQVHNMLSQADSDPPPLDLYVYVAETT